MVWQELRLRWSSRYEANLKSWISKIPFSKKASKESCSFQARRQEELKQLREEQRLHEVAKAGLGEAVEGGQCMSFLLLGEAVEFWLLLTLWSLLLLFLL